jgi:hypothetical protein
LPPLTPDAQVNRLGAGESAGHARRQPARLVVRGHRPVGSVPDPQPADRPRAVQQQHRDRPDGDTRRDHPRDDSRRADRAARWS